jgi:hypothetical protein
MKPAEISRINREYLNGRMNEIATNSRNENIRHLCNGENKCNKGYQPKRNLLKNENVVLFADSCNIENRWGNYFSQLLNEHRVIGS